MPSHTSHSGLFLALLAVGDSLCIFFAVALAAHITLPVSYIAYVPYFLGHAAYFLAFVVAWPLAAINNRLYISRRRDDLLTLVFDITKCVALAVIFTGFVTAFYTDEGTQRTFLSYLGLFAILILSLFRITLQVMLRSIRSRGYNERFVLIIGANERTHQLVSTFLRNPQFGYRLLGYLEDDEVRRLSLNEFNLPCFGAFDQLEQVLMKHVVDEIYISLPVRSFYETIQNMAQLCEGVGVSVRMIADLFPLRLATSRFHKLEGIPILALSTVPENQPQLVLQRLTDIVVSATLLLLFAPVFVFTAVAIKLETHGPVFFYQERVGLNRRRFAMIKFRSMVANAEALRHEVEKLNEADGPIFKASNDPRMTRVGRFIRKYSIDELPQLLNVLKGDMSLVGPRPPLPHEVAQYAWTQRRRLSVKPGMTGLSQVSGRSELSFKDTVDLDLYYIDQWSIGLVFRILFLTVPAVLKGRGAI